MTFKQYQDSLRRNKFKPLPKKEVNELVINREQLDKVAESCQLLIIKCMSKILDFNSTPDSTLFEYVQIGNLAIAEAMNKYIEAKIDFAYFAFVEISNEFIKHHRIHSSVVKSSVVDGKRQRASYLHIDAPISDEVDRFDIPYQEDDEVFSMDLKMIYNIIKEEHHLFKELYIDVYAAYIGMDGEGGKKKVEVADEFGITNQRVTQIVADVENKMRDNKKVLNYLSQFSSK